MLKPRFLAIAALVLATGTATSVAAAQQRNFGVAAALNLEYGGDDVAEVYYADDTSQSVKAGQGVSGLVGVHFHPAQSAFDLSAMVGLKYVTTRASNANIYLLRTVVDVEADYWLTPSVWVGVGPVWHQGGKLHGDGYFDDVQFDDAVGVSAKVGWRWVALGYTGIKYKDQYGDSYSGDNFGVQFIGRF